MIPHFKSSLKIGPLLLSQLRHSSYTFRQIKVLSGLHLTPDQKEYVKGIGGSLTLGQYERRRLPTVTHQQEITPGSGIFVLGKSKARLITAPQRQLVRATANLGQTQVTSFRRAFLNEETIMGTSYGRSKARINSVVVYRDQQQNPKFLQVHSFHLVAVVNGPMTLIALGRDIERVPGVLVPQGNGLVTEEHLAHLNSATFKVLPIQ